MLLQLLENTVIINWARIKDFIPEDDFSLDWNISNFGCKAEGLNSD